MFNRLALAAVAALGGLWMATPSIAQPANISYTVGVCDPKYPQRCVKPNADGSVNVSGSISATTSAKATAAAPTYIEGTNNPLSVDLAGGLRTSGGGGGAVTVADGADVTQGALADAACTTDNGVTCTIAALLKRNNQRLTTINTTLGSPFQAGGSIGNTSFAATQSGTWNITNVSGTVSLPTGAATEASLVKIPLAQGSTTSGQSGSLIQGAVTTAAPAYTTAQTSPVSLDTAGSLRVNITTGTTVVTQPTPANLQAAVSGNIADNVAETSNPVSIGGVYSTSGSLSNYTAGRRTTLQTDLNGNLRVRPNLLMVTAGDASTNAQIGYYQSTVTNVGTGIMPASGTYLFNGTAWDRLRSIQDSTGAGTGVLAIAMAPQSAAGGAIVPVVSTAAEGSHVLKASAGNLYRLAMTTGASAGYVMVFNATSAPADGAVTPQICRVIAANASIEMDYSEMPSRFSTGITAVFSTTGCFTKTISATATIEGYVQ